MSDDIGTLHIYGQLFWHTEAFLLGDRKGLELLRDQIDKALSDGVAEEGFFQSDGEGFPLFVAVCEGEELKALVSAYHDWELFPNCDGKSPFEVVAERLPEPPK